MDADEPHFPYPLPSQYKRLQIDIDSVKIKTKEILEMRIFITNHLLNIHPFLVTHSELTLHGLKTMPTCP